jgi:hypothetical protein
MIRDIHTVTLAWVLSVRDTVQSGPGSSVGIATGYGLDGLGIESGARGGAVVKALRYKTGRSRDRFPMVSEFWRLRWSSG